MRFVSLFYYIRPVTFNYKSTYKSTFMKHFLLLILFAFLLIKLDAQVITENKQDNSRRFHLGVGTGIDNFTGALGISGTLRVTEMVSVRGGFGVGGWGTKSSIGLKFDKGANSKWAYNLGYSACSGLEDFVTELENNSSVNKDVTLDLLSASTLNLAIDRNWRVGRHNLFYLEMGYAVPLQGRRWTVKDGTTLSTDSENFINMMQPGGIIFGLGFAFGL